ncbi:chlorogenic acid esterase precursor protein [Rutstroemia sp. NJR-2017a WRK4]|nr:chlorogenic acid esterase precursor protein [Rutstroemia sp. NJR-2017a WRK4]
MVRLSISALAASGVLVAAASDVLVQTTSGPVYGFYNETAPEVRQFLGIPYAEPPVGDLRFAPPIAKVSNGAIHATTFPPSCMQQFSNSSTIYTAYETQFLINGGTSEDCLYVSVWTPKEEVIAQQQRPLPVFLYVPGGGFTSGGQNSLYKIPDQWVQRTQAHIVVVMNYRVNVFGFPNAKGLTDQNLGLLDQRKAVEWTQANIANFGGDPERIIFWGQSAGGASVSTYAYSYPEDPIVAGIIADSGAPSLLNSQDKIQSNFTFLAGLVGCGDLNSTEELSCVRKVPAQTLENALSWYSSNGTKPAISFGPVQDEKIVFSNYTARALSGKVAKIPEITGSNTNEGAGFVPYTPSGPGSSVLFNTTNNIIACPVAQNVRTRNLANLTTYRYQYAGNFSNISPVSWFGAYHSSELPLLFGTHYEYRANSTPFEYSVSKALQALWLSFAENPGRGPVRLALGGAEGNPGNETLFRWPEFKRGEENMLVVAEGDVLFDLVSGDRIDKYCSL